MIEIFVGDIDLTNRDDLVRIKSFRCDTFLIKGFFASGKENEKIFVDVDELKLDKKKFTWIIEKARVHVIMRISNDKATKYLKGMDLRHKVEVKYVDMWGAKHSIFDVLQSIVNNPDREKVFELLKGNTTMLYMLMKFLISNVEKYLDNAEILDFIDRKVLLRLKPIVLCYLLSYCFVPAERKVSFMRLKIR